jgi:hypothetical protein
MNVLEHVQLVNNMQSADRLIELNPFREKYRVAQKERMFFK